MYSGVVCAVVGLSVCRRSEKGWDRGGAVDVIVAEQGPSDKQRPETTSGNPYSRSSPAASIYRMVASMIL
jgi:hypothetical protein